MPPVDCRFITAAAMICQMVVEKNAVRLAAALPRRAGRPFHHRRPEVYYLLRIVFGFSRNVIGTHLQVDGTLIPHHVRRVENWRDIAQYDALIDQLDLYIRAIARRYAIPVLPLLSLAEACDG